MGWDWGTKVELLDMVGDNARGQIKSGRERALLRLRRTSFGNNGKVGMNNASTYPKKMANWLPRELWKNGLSSKRQRKSVSLQSFLNPMRRIEMEWLQMIKVQHAQHSIWIYTDSAMNTSKNKAGIELQLRIGKETSSQHGQSQSSSIVMRQS